MNNASLKKWIVLASLLLLTLVLVWNAPEPEQTSVVEAVKSSTPVSSSRSNVIQLTTSPSGLELKPRQTGGDIVDLFAVPKRAVPTVAKKPVKPRPVVTQPEKRWELPFRYVGKLQNKGHTTFFMMEGSALYLVGLGDVINEQYRLKQVDDAKNLLVWQHLPSNETRNMSIEQ